MKAFPSSVALAAAGAFSLTSAAVAQDVRVPYGDLDLSTPAGAAELKQRSKAAADAFCLDNARRFAEGPMRDSKAVCRREVLFLITAATPAEQRQALRIARSARNSPPVQVAAR